jgi:hypothetical protein
MLDFAQKEKDSVVEIDDSEVNTADEPATITEE